MSKLRIAALTLGTIAGVGVFQFTDRDKAHLQDVKPPVIEVTWCAYQKTEGGFVVVDGLRTETEHKINRANGKSWIERSKHQDGLAIDFAAKKNGKVTFEIQYYPPIIEAFKKCSQELGIPITSGADWKVKDYMHIEMKVPK